MNKLIVVADDFTGSNDTGLQFRKLGFSSVVILNIERATELEYIDCLVIDSESRTIPKDDAYKCLMEIGQLYKDSLKYLLYKKVDSTLRGNIGAEIEGFLKGSGRKFAFLTSCLPQAGRTIKDGKLLINGIPVLQTEYAKDPKTPTQFNSVRDILASQSSLPIGVINLNTIRQGVVAIEAAIGELLASGVKIISSDAETEGDLENIANALIKEVDQAVISGSAGLAEALARKIKISGKNRPSLFILGSLSEMARKQLDYIRGYENLEILSVDLEGIVLDPFNEKKRILDLVADMMDRGKDVLISTNESLDARSITDRAAKKKGISKIDVANTIGDFLGDLTAKIVKQNKIKSLYITGGDVAIKIMNAQNALGFIIEGEVEHGVPYGFMETKEGKQIRVVTKAGGFGKENTLENIIEFFRRI